MTPLEAVREARRTHERLRSCRPVERSRPENVSAYRTLREALDEIWAENEAVQHDVYWLLVDAEFFAGLSTHGAFRDPADAWACYDRLERSLTTAVR